MLFRSQLEAGKLLAPKVHAVNVTDMQSASLKASSLGLCIALKNAGVEPILQMTGRDRNRMAIMADVLSAASFGIDSVLALTGDHPVVGDCGEKQGQPMITQQDDLWPFGTRDAVLQLLGNAVYGSRAAQDKLREKGGIELVLNHTKMHPKHPLQREWALFTVRARGEDEG